MELVFKYSGADKKIRMENRIKCATMAGAAKGSFS